MSLALRNPLFPVFPSGQPSGGFFSEYLFSNVQLSTFNRRLSAGQRSLVTDL